MSHKIITVDENGPAFGRIFPGDELLNVSGKPVVDVLDYEFYTYDPDITLALRRGDKTLVLRIRKRAGESLGLGFETYLMDRERSCSNRCIFCFIDQNPRGMRPSIYYKDDDARLSFLTGNYITLTNIGEREIDRIIGLHVSPINVSVHTTDPALRCDMLRNPGAGDVLDKMRRLAAGGITMNCQIVCCPGYNDGEALIRTLRDLGALYPSVESVSVVPVGLTAYRGRLIGLDAVDEAKARGIISIVDAFGDGFSKKRNLRFAYCSDELYLKAGREIPGDEYYEDFPQLENGVGMLRLFETEFADALECAGKSHTPMPFSIATGTSAAPFIKNLLRAAGICDNIESAVYAVKNEFFGDSIDVAGLITGGDIAKQLRDRPLFGRLLIPRTMLRRGGEEFLDDMTVEELERILNVRVVPVEMRGDALFDEIFK